MGFFTFKIAIVLLLALIAAIAFPYGALLAARRSRAQYARTPLTRDLSGAQVAGLLLHREGLAKIGVERGAGALGEYYEPRHGKVTLADETYVGRTVHAAATAAFLVAQVTLHADGDRDFFNNHRREGMLTILANLLPPVLFAGLVVPAEGRVFLTIGVPVILCLLAGYTLFSIPAERHAAKRALTLLDRHGISGDKRERIALRSCLQKRAALRLASPLTRCFWINWAL